ncbi:MAG: LuxR C-terminal-related transcriptional regulator [Dysgonamonadaceae bacterium]|jgi:DNA-binding CsgD family transcriptional regulator|nr:LuxR C-terminal-related transcriptional regulator [Dysgonamonadaceae bacterium]
MRKTIRILIFCLFAASEAAACYPVVRNFSKTNSDAGTQTRKIIQHANSAMYFADNRGLTEYNGSRWTVYPMAGGGNVSALYYDESDSRIYAGAAGEFGYYGHNRRGMLQYRSLLPYVQPSDRSFGEIRSIGKSRGVVFFQSDREIFRMDDGKITKTDFTCKIECAAFVHDVLLVASMEEGIMSVNGGLVTPFPGGEQLKGKQVCAMRPFREKQILFVTAGNGLFLYDGLSIRPYETDIDPFLQQNRVLCAEINGTQLALGTLRNGLVVKNLETNETTYANAASGLQNNTVLSLAFDKQGNLWLGLEHGIDYVMINSPVYHLLGDGRRYGSGYCSFVRDNQLYLGTNQGLYTVSFPVRSSPEPVSVHLYDRIVGQVWSLEEIQNTLFCATDRGGFILQNGTALPVPNVGGTWKFLELKRHPNCILASSYAGFFLMEKDGDRWKFSRYIGGFNRSGGMFEEDSIGNIWFCHRQEGVYKLAFNADMTRFSVNRFGTDKGLRSNQNNVPAKIDGEIIISGDGGFFRYNPHNNRMEHAEDYEARFGIHAHALRLMQMPSGEVWCVSPDYCAVGVKEKNGRYRVWQPAFFSALKNRLIFGFENFTPIDSTGGVLIGVENGFMRFDGNRAKTLSRSSRTFPIAIQKVFLTGDKDSLISGYLPKQHQIPTFDYQNNSIRFEYAAAEYRGEHAVTYSVRLEHFDADWSAWSESNTRAYAQLPKGKYTFRVRAQNDLEAGIAETAYQFVILPPWYKSIWAVLIYLVFLTGIVILLIKYIRKKIKESARKTKINPAQEIQEKETGENQQLQFELRQKSQELANAVINLARKNEVLLELNRIIEKTYGDMKTVDALPSITKRMRTMQKEIKQNIDRDDYWKRFAENFDLIYEKYLKRLKERFPNLSKNDLRICAYLKMGMSSKDMAPLLNVSYRSVETIRYRIRQKMDLARDVNLTDFLQGF